MNNAPSAGPVQRLFKIFGPHVVLLKCNGKKPIRKGWQKLRLENMTPRYLATLATGNIGILLGEPSNGLCCVDIDEGSEVEPFLSHNTRLLTSCRVKGERGEKIFLRVQGPFPPKRALKRGGVQVGDWLSTGAQAVIWGIHPETNRPYEFVGMAPPALLAFEKIDFGQFDGNLQLPAGDTWSEDTENTEDTVPTASLHTLHTLHNIRREAHLMAELENIDPRLPDIYDHFVDRMYPARAGSRNATMIKAVEFLSRAFSRDRVTLLMSFWHKFNESVFNTPYPEHMKEVMAALGGSLEKYVTTLRATEAEIYGLLGELEQAVFRILRDLAFTKSNQYNRAFFLSYEELARRIGKECTQAQRLLNKFECRYGIIRTLKKGTRRAIGQRGEATVYQWLLDK